MNYTDKVVWITGATSGIGEALAYKFANENAKLVLSSRRMDELERVQNKCLLICKDCIIIPLDLSKSDNFNELVSKVINTFGRIDLLMNNGGISQRSFIKDTPVDIDRKVFEVNFFGTVALTKAVLPFMLLEKKGHIAVVSSIVGKFGFPLRSAYSASKHALHGFFETLYAENGKDGIMTTVIIPGRINTMISVNAVTSSGEAHNIMDHGQKGGMTSEAAADKIIKALKKSKREVMIGGKDLLMVHIRNYFPRIYYRIVSKVKPK